MKNPLNLKETGINNLDLDLNNTVDFIKVVTKQDGDDFTFILQVAVSKNETQDVGVILVSKDKDGKVTMQIVGDKDLYGKDYIVEPKPATPAITPNPAYTGPDPVTDCRSGINTPLWLSNQHRLYSMYILLFMCPIIRPIIMDIIRLIMRHLQ